MFHLKYLHVFYMEIQKHVKGEHRVNCSLQSLFDDLHVNCMLFIYSVNVQPFPVIIVLEAFQNDIICTV